MVSDAGAFGLTTLAGSLVPFEAAAGGVGATGVGAGGGTWVGAVPLAFLVCFGGASTSLSGGPSGTRAAGTRLAGPAGEVALAAAERLGVARSTGANGSS